MLGKDDRYRYETISSPFTTQMSVISGGNWKLSRFSGESNRRLTARSSVIWGIGSEPSFPRVGRRRTRPSVTTRRPSSYSVRSFPYRRKSTYARSSSPTRLIFTSRRLDGTCCSVGSPGGAGTLGGSFGAAA